MYDFAAAISSLKQQVEALQDINQSVELLIRLLCAIPGWSEKNVQVFWFENIMETSFTNFFISEKLKRSVFWVMQVQQQVIEVITYIASSAMKFPKKCVVLCLLGECFDCFHLNYCSLLVILSHHPNRWLLFWNVLSSSCFYFAIW